MGGFEVDSNWLNQFWLELARMKEGVRAQVHTHPGEAFHSASDDMYPIVRTTGFLSLVIPRFAQGPVSLYASYLTEVQDDGSWSDVDVGHSIMIE